jgi:hypothetical protein
MATAEICPLLRDLRSPAHRVATIVLFAWLLLAQTLLVVHRVDHSITQHGDVCALCLAADHAAGPVPQPALPVVALEPTPVVPLVEVAAPVVTLLSYRSRAPPSLTSQS